ncbi:MAG: isoprenyl transferase [Ruminococcaceae bacterium]|jgi:undecaprenyl diphosphate synthase|nr:isoprenyl transferase [Oscillospiraceae bacterium]
MSRLSNLLKLLSARRRPARQAQGPAAQETTASLRIPRHLAVFMDGNGRWALQRGLPRTAGHRAGAENLQNLCRMCGQRGIQYLTVYAFSTENWSRPREEVEALMALFVEFFDRYSQQLARQGIRVRFSGDRKELPQDVRRIMSRAEEESRARQKLQLIIAINYGGRREIVQACRTLARAAADGRLDPETLDEAAITNALYLPDVPDPDLIIRPSGEQRLSNFLLWQAAYSELWFAHVLWPDFNEDHLDAALQEFTRRERRFGGLDRQGRPPEGDNRTTDQERGSHRL